MMFERLAEVSFKRTDSYVSKICFVSILCLVMTYHEDILSNFFIFFIDNIRIRSSYTESSKDFHSDVSLMTMLF